MHLNISAIYLVRWISGNFFNAAQSELATFHSNYNFGRRNFFFFPHTHIFMEYIWISQSIKSFFVVIVENLNGKINTNTFFHSNIQMNPINFRKESDLTRTEKNCVNYDHWKCYRNFHINGITKDECNFCFFFFLNCKKKIIKSC